MCSSDLGVYPISAVLGSRELLRLFQPGDHGSTFGGNPLAAAVGRASLAVLVEENLAARAAELGQHLLASVRGLRAPVVTDVRGKGLLIGIEVAPAHGTARKFCEQLARRGVLVKDTHEQVVRLAPPLVVTRAEIDWLAMQLDAVLR